VPRDFGEVFSSVRFFGRVREWSCTSVAISGASATAFVAMSGIFRRRVRLDEHAHGVGAGFLESVAGRVPDPLATPWSRQKSTRVSQLATIGPRPLKRRTTHRPKTWQDWSLGVPNGAGVSRANASLVQLQRGAKRRLAPRILLAWGSVGAEIAMRRGTRRGAPEHQPDCGHGGTPLFRLLIIQRAPLWPVQKSLRHESAKNLENEPKQFASSSATSVCYVSQKRTSLQRPNLNCEATNPGKACSCIFVHAASTPRL
jgi:hypothetical protein